VALFESVQSRPLMGVSGLLFFYRERLRDQAVEELFAGVGIAAAVALLFAVTVASRSIAGSAEKVNKALVGPATLQLRARGSEGLSENLLARVDALAGVERAAPLLEENATLVSHGGAGVPVSLAGTNVSLATLDGLLHTLPLATLSNGGLGISRSTAEALHLPATSVQAPTQKVLLELRGTARMLPVNTELGPETFGALSQARVAVMPLEFLQRLAGLPRRLTRILVQSTPGSEARVRAELNKLAAGRLNVASTRQDVQLLRVALRPGEQASLFFAGISAVLGFLLTFNAFLLTVPERRMAIADLRLRGTRSSAIVQMVLFQALCLGVVATAGGLAVGYVLSVAVFAQTPNYLARGFTLGSGTIIGVAPLLVAGLGGVLATCLASIVPLLDLRHGRAANAVYLEGGEPGNAVAGRTAIALALVAVALVLVRIIANSLWPSLALAWTAILAIAAVLCVPLLFSIVLRLGEAVAERFQLHLKLLPLAIEALRETRLRSLALMATGAAALFGAVALGGARDDLTAGIAKLAAHYADEGDIWVFTPNDNQSVTAFVAGTREQRLARLPGVKSVTALGGGLLDVGRRRVWVLAWPSSSSFSILDGQIVAGEQPVVVARLRSGGWTAISQQLAAEQHVKIGQTIRLPTPAGDVPFRVAALTTNFGWSSGAIVMSTGAYTRAWQTTQPTAFTIEVKPGFAAQAVRREVERALGPANGLEVLLATGREAKITGMVREGLAQLATISTLLVIASILAMAAALASAIWQRRASLATLKLSGVREGRLRKLLILESGLMLSVGAIAGAAWGVYGQVALDSYLKATTGFPVQPLAASTRPIEVLLVVFLASMLISLIPTWFTARVPTFVALEE
jgi:putative ABC transport system permease protein